MKRSALASAAVALLASTPLQGYGYGYDTTYYRKRAAAPQHPTNKRKQIKLRRKQKHRRTR